MSISTEHLVGLVLSAAHERLQQRCNQAKIVALLEDKHGAYDVDAVHSLLKMRYDRIEEEGALPLRESWSDWSRRQALAVTYGIVSTAMVAPVRSGAARRPSRRPRNLPNFR